MKKILILPSTALINEMTGIANLLKINNKVGFIIPDEKSIINKITSRKFKIYDKFNLRLNVDYDNVYKRKLQKSVHFIFLIIKIFFKTLKIFIKYKPTHCIVNEDRTSSFNVVFLNMAKLFNIRNIIVAGANTAAIEMVKKRRNIKDFIIDAKSNYEFINKIELFNSKKIKILFYPLYQAKILSFFNFLPLDCRLAGSSKAIDEIITLDKTDYEFYVNNTNKKISLVESLENKKIYKSAVHKKVLQKKIISKYNLKKNKPIIIINISPRFEREEMNKEKSIKLIDIFLYFFKNNFFIYDINLLISLHPKCDYENYKWIEKKHKIKILSENLHDIIGVARIFISDHYTSSVKIANKINIRSIVLTIIESRNKKAKQTTYLNFLHKKKNLEIIKNEIKNKERKFQIRKGSNSQKSIDQLI